MGGKTRHDMAQGEGVGVPHDESRKLSFRGLWCISVVATSCSEGWCGAAGDVGGRSSVVGVTQSVLPTVGELMLLRMELCMMLCVVLVLVLDSSVVASSVPAPFVCTLCGGAVRSTPHRVFCCARRTTCVFDSDAPRVLICQQLENSQY